ncbi:MAG TPA: ABC transporter permease [Actinomycetota bacterium]|nr:ABC transporter permease [Actinomycetota bacterium]
MGRYIIRRVLWVALVMLIVTFFAFLIFYVMPTADAATIFAGRQPTPETIAEVRKQFGLDKEWYEQYGKFVSDIVTGDEYGWPGFNMSYATRAPIRETIFDRVGVTFQLAVGAAVLWLAIGIPIGIVSAIRKGKMPDRIGMGFALFGVSAPVFWLGIMSLFIFWHKLQWTPGTGYVPFGEDPGEWFGHMILPWGVLSMLYAAVYARMVRSNLLETMGEDYIRTARAKGLKESRVIGKHGLRASLTPVVTMIGLDFGVLLGGAVVTESVFNMNGLGSFLINSVRVGDLPSVTAVIVFAAFFVTFLNLIVDIVYAYLDPRVRYA